MSPFTDELVSKFIGHEYPWTVDKGPPRIGITRAFLLGAYTRTSCTPAQLATALTGWQATLTLLSAVQAGEVSLVSAGCARDTWHPLSFRMEQPHHPNGHPASAGIK